MRRRRALVDTLLAGALLLMVGAIVDVGVESSRVDAERDYVEAQAVELHAAFERYFERHRAYPGVSGPTIDLASLEPLGRRGYYRGGISSRLIDGRLDAYHATGEGSDQEYWMELTLAANPSVRFVVAHSDDAPLGGGRWLDGAYLYTGGELSPL